jgi:hypothetical protein
MNYRKKSQQAIERLNFAASKKQFSTEFDEQERIIERKDHKEKVSIADIARVEEEDVITERLTRIIESRTFNITILVLSVYSLFAEDLKIIFVPGKYDAVFSVISIIVLICFIFEIVITVILDEHYICGLYFWVDVVSTFSILLDIHWIYELFNSEKSRAIRQIGRGGRLTARAFRLLRFARTIRVWTKSRKLNLNQLSIQNSKLYIK